MLREELLMVWAFLILKIFKLHKNLYQAMKNKIR